jgi:transcriptional regulator GlxA family with amidase domain
MTSINAKLQNEKHNPDLVVFVIYPNFVLLDLSGPLQVFSHAQSPETHQAAYETAIVSAEGGTVNSNTIVSIESAPISEVLGQSIHTLIVVGGDGAYEAMHDEKLVEAIGNLAASAERVCSVCSGALILAATGLLDGRRAVTHWEDCRQLADEFPRILVEIDPIFIKDGDVWTSAGMTAGMDMALAVIAEDLGRPAALEMARSMVTHMARSGGQSQFSPALDRQSLDSEGRFDQLHGWIADNLQLDLRVDELAAQTNMSPRNFSRIYSSQMKVTPAKAVGAIRVEIARELLETTAQGVKEIAGRCGFSDDERMRRAFIKTLKTSPTEYRLRFPMDSD